jgi:hypothetical protein
MARQKTARNGKCFLCEGIFDKSAMTRHLAKCLREHEAQPDASSMKKPRASAALHLIVEGRYLPEYWMHLAAPADTSLGMLDQFLRDIWLECCGHMSAFAIDEVNYSVSPMDEFDDEDMSAKLGDVVRPGTMFTHQYDFGSTTELALKVVSELEHGPADRKIQILARNEPPPIVCTSCGQPATRVCTQCLYDGKGWLCDKCVGTHKCDDEMLLPVVNSPRVGVCGYTG